MTTHNPKFRGTPGPWRVDGHEHKNGVVEYTIVSISGDAVGCAPVAEVLRNNPRPIPEHRVEANARLLAAAPDLLAALESLVETFDPDRQVIYSLAGRSKRQNTPSNTSINQIVNNNENSRRP